MMKKTVCVLFGGNSSEHEISCLSAGNVVLHLDKDLFDVVTVGITKEGDWFLTKASPEQIKSGEWKDLNNKTCVLSPSNSHHGLLVFNKNGDVSLTHVDVMYPVLHGKNGEDGTMQGLFTLAGIPFVGPDVLSSSLCMDKDMTKRVLSAAGIPVTEGFCVRREYDLEAVHNEIENSFGYPVVVKPSRAGSSVGVSFVTEKNELQQALSIAANEDDKILIERAVDAREVECAVLGTTVSPKASCCGEIVNDGMYDYETKYVKNTAGLNIPADLTKEQEETIRDLARRAFTAVEGHGLSRIDFFIDKKTGAIMLNEINTLPGFTDISMYPMLWKASGLSYAELLTELIGLAR